LPETTYYTLQKISCQHQKKFDGGI